MNEMSESLNIINQIISKLTQKKSLKKNIKTQLSPHKLLRYLEPTIFNKLKKKNNYNNMEQLIKHFKY